MVDKQQTTEPTYKVLLLGDSSVGKTCFLKRYIDNTFQDAYLSTIGFDFKFKNVELNNGKTVRVQIWDTAGQERFRTIAKSYYRGAHGILLIYDVTARGTFENIRKWLTQIKQEAPKRTSIIIVANKIDCEEREVTKEEGEELGKTSGLTVFEASAKDSINVKESFQDLVEKISETFANISLNSSKLKNEKNVNKKGCC